MMSEVQKISREYFNQETEQAIIEYVKCTDFQRRNFLYEKYIKSAFLQLTEVLINNYHFYYVDDTVLSAQNKTIEYLMEKLKKYDQKKGKAFSYFNVVAKNYLIGENTRNFNAIKKFEDISLRDDLYDDSDEDIEEKIDFFEKFILFLELNLEEFFKPNKEEYKIVLALLEILQRRDHLKEYLNDYNKKAIYLMVKEITNVQSIKITRVVAKLKKIYKNVYNNYLETENIFYKKIKQRNSCQQVILIK